MRTQNASAAGFCGGSWQLRRSQRAIQLSAASRIASPRVWPTASAYRARRAVASSGQRAPIRGFPSDERGRPGSIGRARAVRDATRLAFFRGFLSFEPFGRPGFRLGLGSARIASEAVSALGVMRWFQSVGLGGFALWLRRSHGYRGRRARLCRHVRSGRALWGRSASNFPASQKPSLTCARISASGRA